MSLNKISEGWKNHLLPEESQKAFIEYVHQKRMRVCEACEFHSKNHFTIRPDVHCTNCGCTLSAKTKCLTCECPLKAWLSETLPTKDELNT
jgi:hypothetical protein